jgi:hypothetical protein
VLNPAVRMSWINKHWDAEYQKRAQNILKTMVCVPWHSYLIVLTCFSWHSIAPRLWCLS